MNPNHSPLRVLCLPVLSLAAVLGGAQGAAAQNSGLDWMRFLGGAGDENAGWPNGLYVDDNGDVWVGGTDAGVAPAGATLARLSSTGQLLASTTLGAAGSSRANAIGTDAAGRVYVAGSTSDPNFPVVGTAPFGTPLQPSPGGGQDMFLTILDGTTLSILYSTYVGGTEADVCTGLQVDAGGRVWLYGSTGSAAFPVTPSAFQGSYGGGTDAVVCCIDPLVSGAAALVYGTFFGGSGLEGPSDLLLHADGTLSFAGLTAGGLVPTANAFQPAYGGGTFDGFYARLDPNAAPANQLLYCTYVGGNDQDNGNGLSVQGSLVTIGGFTQSTDLPTSLPHLPPAIQSVKNLGNDAFVLQFDLAASGPGALRYCTYLGGSSSDGANDLVVDAAGNITIVGVGGSTNYPPTPGAYVLPQQVNGARAIVSKIDPVAGRLLYSTTLVHATGGTQGFVARADGLGGIYLLGRSAAPGLPVTTGPNHAGGWDLLVARWNLQPLGAARCGSSTPSSVGLSFVRATEQPRSGSTTFAVTVGGAPSTCPTTLGVVLLGLTRGSTPCAPVPLPPFGTLFVQQPWITLGIVPPNGSRVDWPLPLLGVPAGTFFAIEFVWFEPCTGILGASDALEVTVQ